MPPLASSSKPSRRSSVGERGQPGLVVDGEERAGRSCRDQLPDDLGQEPVLDRLDPRVQRLGACRPRAPAPRSWRSTGPVSTPSSTRWTVAPVSVDPGRERVLDGVRAGKGGQQRRMHVDDPRRETGRGSTAAAGACSPRRRRARRRAPRASRPSPRRARRGRRSRRAGTPRSGTPSRCGSRERPRAGDVRRDGRDR